MVIIVIVALVVLDLGGLTGDSAASVPVIQIGSATALGESQGAPATSIAPGSSSLALEPGSDPEQAQGTGSTTGSGGTIAPGSAALGSTALGSSMQAGKTTVVTTGLRVEPGPQYQGGSSTTLTSTPTTTATTATGTPAGSSSTVRASTSTSTTGGQGPTSTGGSHGPSSTGQGR